MRRWLYRNAGASISPSQLEKPTGTRMSGFVLTRQRAAGKWGSATYALKETGEEEGQRVYGEYQAEAPPPDQTETPYAPYAPYAPSRALSSPTGPSTFWRSICRTIGETCQSRDIARGHVAFGLTTLLQARPSRCLDHLAAPTWHDPVLCDCRREQPDLPSRTGCHPPHFPQSVVPDRRQGRDDIPPEGLACRPLALRAWTKKTRRSSPSSRRRPCSRAGSVLKKGLD
jgi:hypothetical protein